MTFEVNHIGRHINNYRVIAEIGSGGFARVYRGEHAFLKERTVAIKLLHTYLSSSEECERFLLEAGMLEKLKHPHILLIYDVGVDQGFPYLIVEYATHGSLRDRLRSAPHHPLPTAEAVRILSQVGQALHFAHQHNIIHRDLKPENILFNSDDQALLADFGIAMTLTSASYTSVKITGTPSYMAPEQFAGNVSKESDQYALGCIAYELVTGQPPFSADNMFATGFKHLKEDPIAPTQLNPNVPVYVEWAVLRAMAKERANRFPNLDAFVSALHEPTLSLSPGTPVPPRDTSPLIHTAPAFSPPLVSSASHAALQAQEAEKTQPLVQENTSADTLYETAPRQYQEPFSQHPPVTPLPPFPEEPFSAQGWMTDIPSGVITQREKRGNKRRLMIVGIASLLTVASILAALLFAAFPGTSRGSGFLVMGTQTAAVGPEFPLLTATSKRTGTSRVKQTNTPVSHPQGTPTIVPTATATPPSATATTASTATPTPTPTPIVETLTVSFNNPNGTYTQH
jgi:serine/threonine protein kinase